VYSPDPCNLDLLRALCERQGVTPQDADLEAVQGLLRLILPALERLDARIPDEIAATP
jgi:hypothetical protein